MHDAAVKQRWYKHPQHGYMLRFNDTIVTSLCQNTAEIEENKDLWEAHKSRLRVNVGCGAIAADWQPDYVLHNPEFVRVKDETVPKHIKDDFFPFTHDEK